MSVRAAGRFSALALLVLAGCASQRSHIGDGGARPLLAPATLGEERSVTQIVRGAFGPREMTMNCVVTVKDGVMTVVGLNAMGVRVFTIRYDGAMTTVDNSLPVPPQLTPERLLADLQLVHWPLRPLQSALSNGGWELSEPAPGTRRLRRGEQLIAEVHYAGADPWQGRSWLVNLEHGYTLSIESKAM
ncbi:MAG TPA: DUF3261 domain-containing protein [Steroidobacteraceae bacterium]